MEIANIPSLEHLDSGAFSVERGIPVMRPHKAYKLGADGKPDLTQLLYEVTEADLEEICANANKPAEQEGHFPRFTIGHTSKIKGVPELSQPAKWIGAAVRYRVGQMPKSGAKVILSDLYTANDLEESAKGFPYRSAEYNWSEKRICGVAKLLKDPALHLGTVMCEAESHLSYGGGAVQEGENDIDLANTPAIAPLNPDEAFAADRLWAYFAGKYEGLKSLEACASGTNTALPEQKPAPAHTLDGDKDKDDDHMAQNEANDLIVAENTSLKSQVAALTAQVNKAAIKADLDRLELVENLEFDRAEAEVVMLERDEPGRARYTESIRKFGRKKAGAAGVETPIQVLETTPTVMPGVNPKEMNREQFAQVRAIQAKNPGFTWEQAKAVLTK